MCILQGPEQKSLCVYSFLAFSPGLCVLFGSMCLVVFQRNQLPVCLFGTYVLISNNFSRILPNVFNSNQINIMKICSKYLSSYTNEISSSYIKSTKLNGFDFVKPNCAQKAVAAACMHACIMHGQLFLLLRCNFKDVFELHLGIIDGATSHVMTLCVRLLHEFQVFTIKKKPVRLFGPCVFNYYFKESRPVCLIRSVCLSIY